MFRHHLVESVSFATTSGESYHGEIAAIQTPTREYFILRDVGLIIGSEEEGVAELWQDVLRCDSRGLPTLRNLGQG